MDKNLLEDIINSIPDFIGYQLTLNGQKYPNDFCFNGTIRFMNEYQKNCPRLAQNLTQWWLDGVDIASEEFLTAYQIVMDEMFQDGILHMGRITVWLHVVIEISAKALAAGETSIISKITNLAQRKLRQLANQTQKKSSMSLIGKIMTTIATLLNIFEYRWV